MDDGLPPLPWTMKVVGDEFDYGLIRDSDKDPVWLARPDVARRIVAAVNATAGVTLETLESPEFRDGLKAAGLLPMEAD